MNKDKKKNIITGGLALGVAGLCLLLGVKHPKIYTRKWIESLSDIEWEKEREDTAKIIGPNS